MDSPTNTLKSLLYLRLGESNLNNSGKAFELKNHSKVSFLNKGRKVIFILYIDDIILTTNHEEEIRQSEFFLGKGFN